MTLVPLSDWPVDLRGKVLASRRFNPITVTPAPWARLRDRALGTVIGSVQDGLEAAHERTAAHLASEARPTEIPDADTGAVLLVRAIDDQRHVWKGKVLVPQRPALADAAIDHLVLAGGHAFALEAVAEASAILVDREVLRRYPRKFDHDAIQVALRLRQHLSTAPAAAYDAALACAASRITALPPVARLIVAIAFPGESFSHDALFAMMSGGAHFFERSFIASCFYDVADLARMGAIGDGQTSLTLLAQLGLAVVPFLRMAVTSVETAQALTLCGTTEALGLLFDATLVSNKVEPYFELAAERWPELARRVLEERAREKSSPNAAILASALLRKLSAKDHDAAAELRAGLDDPDLPRILREPPWLAPKAKKTKTPSKSRAGSVTPELVVPATPDELLPSDDPPQVTSRQTLDETKRYLGYRGFSAALLDALLANEPGATEALVAAIERNGRPYLGLLLRAPIELCDAFLERLAPHLWSLDARDLQALVSERGLAALPMLEKLGAAHSRDVIAGAMRVRSPRLAVIAATSFASKTGREPARRWLDAHPRAAAIGLLDVIAGAGDRSKKTAAEDALRELAKLGHEAVVRAVATETRPDASELVKEILARDPLSRFPAKLPPIPEFAEVDRLAPPLLRRGDPAPRFVVERLLQMLMFSTLEEPYAGLELALPAFSPSSLAAFSWALFEAWRVVGQQPSKEIWAYHQLALLSGDTHARALARYIRAWPGALVTVQPGAVGHATTTGIELLAYLQTPIALGELASLAQKSKPKLEALAKTKLAAIAASRGLELRELLDSLTPDFDLDARGTRVIDYGPRKLTLELDDDLVPFVLDDRSTRHPAPPKAEPGDDASLVASASADFKTLKKDLAKILSRERGRLEEAMVQRETFTLEQPLFNHPVLSRLARRLVWIAAPNGARVLFVWSEEGSPRTLSGEPFDPAPTEPLRIVHPSELDATELRALRALLGTARPLFAQLDRPVFALRPDERALGALERFRGSVPSTSLYRLEARGWTPIKGDSQIDGYTRRLGDFAVSIDLTPGLPLAARSLEPLQVVSSPVVTRAGAPATFGELSASAASEALLAVTELFADAGP
ncbi:MAG: DUF4132 domain-containing protein [Polyangiaceae bacterium]